MAKHVTIVANGLSKKDFNEKDHKNEVWYWASAGKGRNVKEKDSIFELHIDIWDTYEHAWNRIFILSDRVKKAGEYLDYLKKTKARVYMAYKDSSIPNSIKFPFEQLVKIYGPMFDNSVAWMLALAIEYGYKKITIFGFDNPEPEARGNHAMTYYFLGIAVAMGIEICTPESSVLMIPCNTKPFELYGIRENVSEFYKKFDAGKSEAYKKMEEKWLSLSQT